METKIQDEHLESIVCRLDFSYFVLVLPVGCKGGLVFCWRPGLQFEILSLSSSIFHFLICPCAGKQNFLCSFVYGPPYWRHKEEFWEALGRLGGSHDKPWVCTGILMRF